MKLIQTLLHFARCGLLLAIEEKVNLVQVFNLSSIVLNLRVQKIFIFSHSINNTNLFRSIFQPLLSCFCWIAKPLNLRVRNYVKLEFFFLRIKFYQYQFCCYFLDEVRHKHSPPVVWLYTSVTESTLWKEESWQLSAFTSHTLWASRLRKV